MTNKITPFLWFDGQAEEATNFYVSIFKNSKVLTIMPGPGGKAMGTSFEIEGQRFMTLNGGPQFKFNESVSFYVECEDQAEVDYFWEKLLEGGQESMCGWLKDKYGVSWQIIPKDLPKMLGDQDRQKAGRAMQAMLKMKKINIAEMQTAFEGK